MFWMRISRRNGVIVFALVAAVVIVFVASRDQQPRHDQKPLSDWMLELLSTYPRRNPETIQALRAMGDPAIRKLAEIVEQEDSTLTKALLEHADKAPVIADIVPSKYWYRFMAAMALGEIGTNAASATPVLKKMSADPDPNLARVANAALVLVQNEPIRNYVSSSLDYNSTNAGKAYGILMTLGPHAKEGIPAYLKELESTNSRIRLRALIMLESICTESPECVPVFTNLLTDPDKLIRVFAIDGLSNCGEMAKSAASAVAKFLESPDNGCRGSALVFLLRVIPPEEFQPFADPVRRATNDVDEVVRGLAVKLLNEKRFN